LPAKGYVKIDEERCKSCELCVAVCPKKVLRVSDRINSSGYQPVEQHEDGCIACGMCATMCPDVAIEVYRYEEEGE